MASAWGNTLSVWQGLFLREALDRFFGSRAGWAWLVIEPAIHIAFLGFLWGVIRQRSIGGVDIIMWITTGMLAFFLFRRTAVQTLHALDCNKAFFAFRQVRPFDVSLCRASVEGFSMFFISLFILACAGLLGFDVVPDNPLLVMLALTGLWLFALGYGLITSVCMRLVPDSGHIFQILMMPLYLISCVIWPLSMVPQRYRDLVLINPLVHGIEAVRKGFFNGYYAPDYDLNYLFMWVLLFLLVGLALFRTFEARLVTR